MPSMDEVIGNFKARDTLFIPGASAEPRAFVEALAATSSELPELTVINSFVPGINPLPLAAENNHIHETTVFPRKPFANSEHRLKLLPLSYHGFAKQLSSMSFDWAVIHVSPPNDDGRCSLGVSVEFTPVVMRQSKRLIGIVNQQMPFVAGAPSLAIDDFHSIIETNTPLVNYDPGAASSTASTIASHIKTLIECGSVLQLGLGKIPNQLVSSLQDMKDLCFHSGMLSDGFLELAEAGALNKSFTHTSCCALGSSEFYDKLKDLDNLSLVGVDTTHAPTTLAQYDRFVAINSAVSVDLLGQANLETIGKHVISSVGGAPDFARAARCSKNGKSIITLPATSADGKHSRITAQLPPSNPISLGRYDIDYVVTEFGTASFAGKSVRERAQALIDIAAPCFREELEANMHTLHAQ